MTGDRPRTIPAERLYFAIEQATQKTNNNLKQPKLGRNISVTSGMMVAYPGWTTTASNNANTRS
jgi:hypothetical protein